MFIKFHTDRSQYTDLNGERSEVMSQPYGVPKWSVIEPLLFLIYTNDLPTSIVGASTLLFADDTKLYANGKTADMANDRMIEAIKQASVWFSANSQQLNCSKTQSVILPTHRCVHRQEPVNRLGIRIDQHLTWSSQVDQVCSSN